VRAAVLVLLLATPAFAEDAAEKDPLVRALRDELARVARLRLPGVPAPYHLAYQVVDFDRLRVAASFGALVDRDRQRERYLRADVRVGDAKLDSSNFFGELGFEPPELLQIGDDYDALRHEIWHVTDRMYKHAVERLEKKRAAEKGQAPDPERVGDFSPAEPVRVVSTIKPSAPDAARLEALVTKASAAFRAHHELHGGKATISTVAMRRVLVTSEGALVVEPKQLHRLWMSCHTQADDGMRLDHQLVTTVSSIDDLPGPDELAAAARRMAEELAALRKAPPAEAYTGPVLFEATAAAQLLRALLVDELSGTPPPRGGHRFGRDAPQGTRLGEKVGQRVLPLDFRVEDDPSLPRVGGYAVDDEGVPAQKVVLVDKGMLKGFLMSRAPRMGFAKSNGHGRAGVQGEARGTPSNLVVSAKKAVADKELKKRLLARARQEGLTYAVVIRMLEEPGISEGGARVITFGDDDDEQRLPRPLVAYKIGLDGKEEPLRGLALGPLPLRALKNILAAGKTPAVIAWFGGGRAASFAGEPTVPITLASPALLFEDVELVKSSAPQKKPPVLPRP
jgi:TldD protein